MSVWASEKKAVPIKQGEPAPFSGQLLTTELAITIGQKAERCDAETKIRLDRAASQCALELGLQARLTEIERDRANQIRDVANRNAREADRWYRSPGFVATVSVVSTLALVLVTGWALGSVAK